MACQRCINYTVFGEKNIWLPSCRSTVGNPFLPRTGKSHFTKLILEWYSLGNFLGIFTTSDISLGCHVWALCSVSVYLLSISEALAHRVIVLTSKRWLLKSIFIYLIFFLNFYLFTYLFMAVLGLRFCARAFSSCGKWGPPFIAVRGPLIIAASLVAEHRLQTRRLSNCGSRA